MIGAILTTAAFALLASTITTVGNFAIARDFPGYEIDPKSDVLLDSPLVIRFMQYRIMTNVFYHQARALWALLGVLLVYKFLSSL